MHSAGTGNASGKDLCSFGNELTELSCILVIDCGYLVGAELTTLTIADVAKRSFMSEVYFRKLFREEYGTSPQKYIVNLRIQNAAGLISTGYYSLKEVALMSGYNDYKYFSVEFKRIMGASPSEYFYNFEK